MDCAPAVVTYDNSKQITTNDFFIFNSLIDCYFHHIVDGNTAHLVLIGSCCSARSTGCHHPWYPVGDADLTVLIDILRVEGHKRQLSLAAVECLHKDALATVVLSGIGRALSPA